MNAFHDRGPLQAMVRYMVLPFKCFRFMGFSFFSFGC